MTYVEQWQSEEKAANTFIALKINPEDTNFQSGIILDNLIQILSQNFNPQLDDVPVRASCFSMLYDKRGHNL